MIEFFSNAIDFLAKGGILMVFIFLASLIAIVLFIERLIVFRRECKQIQALKDPLKNAIRQGQFERAQTQTDNHPCILGIISSVALEHRNHHRDGIQEAISDEARRQYASLNRFIPTIGAIATLSPLLGLLGTVTGMIQVFSKLADEYAMGAVANPGMLAGGIWEALLTTAAGLCVAIPAFLFHRALNARLDAIMLDVEKDATQILDILAPYPETDSSVSETKTAEKPKSEKNKQKSKTKSSESDS